MKLIRDIVRGSGTLPHVGSHPGLPFVLIMGGMAALAGANKGGVQGFLFGLILSTLVFGTMFAIGAASRARLSDRLETRSGGGTTPGDLVGRRVADLHEDKRSAGCVIEIRNGEVIVNGEPHAKGPLKGVVELRITTGTAVSVMTDVSVVCDDVNGPVNAGGNVSCGNVGGSISAGGNVNCDDVGGSIRAAGNVNAS